MARTAFVLIMLAAALLALSFQLTTLLSAAADPIVPSDIRIVDGDTIVAHGQKYRLVGFDAPETGERARCDAENQLGYRATLRLRSLVVSGHLDLVAVRCSCRPEIQGTRACNYGRACGRLTVKGEDVSGILIREGLARAYICGVDRCPPRKPWCS